MFYSDEFKVILFEIHVFIVDAIFPRRVVFYQFLTIQGKFDRNTIRDINSDPKKTELRQRSVFKYLVSNRKSNYNVIFEEFEEALKNACR